jgi:hypothetical protein
MCPEKPGTAETLTRATMRRSSIVPICGHAAAGSGVRLLLDIREPLLQESGRALDGHLRRCPPRDVQTNSSEPTEQSTPPDELVGPASS